MKGMKITTERLTAFSDGVFAVIITIMVLDLKPPAEATLTALLPLWPTALSYAVSYLFVAIIWVNHHYLFSFAREATPRLIWLNFAHLFVVSLVPAATAWMAASRLAGAPVFIYSLVFVFVETAYIAYERAVFAQAADTDISPQLRRIANMRSYLAFGLFVSAAALSFWFPRCGLALVCCVLLVYFSPRVPKIFQHSVSESLFHKHGSSGGTP